MGKYISKVRVLTVIIVVAILMIIFPKHFIKNPVSEADYSRRANIDSAGQVTESTTVPHVTNGNVSFQSPSAKSPVPQSTPDEKPIEYGKSSDGELIKMYPLLGVLPDEIKQIIFVKSAKAADVNVVVEAFQRSDSGNWQLVISTRGVVGRNGMSSDRKEGDGTTPMGFFSLPFVFGSAENPGTLLEYRKTRPGDLWVSHPLKSEEYNVFLHYAGDDAKARFIEYEDLYPISLYKYSAVLDFNYDKLKVIGRGSAIFLHIAPQNGSGTAGCIGIREDELVTILKWLTPSKNPRIAIGTDEYLSKLKPVLIKEKDGFVRLDELDENILVELRYATTDNFTGKVVYPSNIGILRKDTAIKLGKVNLELREMGLRLKVWDAFRPVYVQKLFWDLVKDARFVANPEAGLSKHNTGCAVDVTLVDKAGNELKMPSLFDDFSEKAFRNNPSMDETARKNMDILTKTMVKYGFRAIDSEWWHFEDTDSYKYQAADVNPASFR